MMSADLAQTQQYRALLRTDGNGVGSVGPAAYTTSATAGTGQAMVGHRSGSPFIAAQQDPSQVSVKPAATSRVVTSSDGLGVERLATPTDRVGRVFGKVWSGVKRVVSHTYDQIKAVPFIGAPLRGIDRVREFIRFVNVDKADVASLRPGDVILCSSIGPMEAGIQTVTASRFNHAALYVGNGMVIDATSCYGIKQRPLAEVIRGRFQVFVMRDDSLSGADRKAIVHAAEKFLGGTYSNWSAVGGGTIKNVPGKDTYARAKMCSELVWDVYFNALDGKRLTAINLPAPSDLALSGTLSVAARLV